jgi:ATP-dependent Lon protease
MAKSGTRRALRRIVGVVLKNDLKVLSWLKRAMSGRGQTKQTKLRLHDEHDVSYRYTFGELCEMYPNMSIAKVRQLKRVQDDTLNEQFTIMDILQLDCKHSKKVELYKMFTVKDSCMDFTDEYFEIDRRIKKTIKDVAKPKQSTYKERVLQLQCSDETRQTLLAHCKQMKGITDQEEHSKMALWIESALQLPYQLQKHVDVTDRTVGAFMQHATQMLNSVVYGLADVKEAILRYMCIKVMNPNAKALSLALCGPPGVGKTAISRAISQILELPFYQIALGGITNPEFLKGFESTYIASKSGEIVRALQFMKYNNGVLFFDEYDKIEDNKDICNALLHITDPEQNSDFRDSYLHSIKVDLSNLWFVFSMNGVPNNKPLADRLNIIHIAPYSAAEKREICAKFLLPKLCRSLQMAEDDIRCTNDAIESLVASSPDCSIRYLQNRLSQFVQKMYVYKVTNNSLKLDVDATFPLVADAALLKRVLSKCDDESTPTFMYT